MTTGIMPRWAMKTSGCVPVPRDHIQPKLIPVSATPAMYAPPPRVDFNKRPQSKKDFWVIGYIYNRSSAISTERRVNRFAQSSAFHSVHSAACFRADEPRISARPALAPPMSGLKTRQTRPVPTAQIHTVLMCKYRPHATLATLDEWLTHRPFLRRSP